MAAEPIPTHAFALVVVRRGDRFLLVHERKHGGGWYLPAGRVEAGETLAEAAHRETLEESGVAIELEGLVRLEHRPYEGGARLRAFFVARPRPGAEPRTSPNEHSLGARFVTLTEARALPLRDPEALRLCELVSAGAPILPIEAIAREV